MNTATFYPPHFEEGKSFPRVKVHAPQNSGPTPAKTHLQDEAYWAKRADELFSVHVDKTSPTTSGRFGSFLY